MPRQIEHNRNWAGLEKLCTKTMNNALSKFLRKKSEKNMKSYMAKDGTRHSSIIRTSMLHNKLNKAQNKTQFEWDLIDEKGKTLKRVCLTQTDAMEKMKFELGSLGWSLRRISY